MGLKKSIEKLDDYHERLDAGKVKKIKPAHLAKIAEKLAAKETSLLADLEEMNRPSKKERLERKLALVREQQARAKWLAEQLED